jgi:dTDP-4-amino-4,6-dideoxygalactose transaminase
MRAGQLALAGPPRLALLTESRQSRDRMYAASEARGLGLGLMYPAPVTAIDELKDRFVGEHVPGAQFVAERLLTVPTHHLLSELDKRAVCELVQQQARARVAA